MTILISLAQEILSYESSFSWYMVWFSYYTILICFCNIQFIYAVCALRIKQTPLTNVQNNIHYFGVSTIVESQTFCELTEFIANTKIIVLNLYNCNINYCECNCRDLVKIKKLSSF